MTSEAIETTETEVPKNHAYVFCPEEPQLQIQVAGRMLAFSNGRLDTLGGKYKLSQAEVDYFIANEEHAPHFLSQEGNQVPRFIVWMDSMGPLKQAVLLITERVFMACGRKAWANNVVKINDDARMTVAVMLSTDTGVADIAPRSSEGLAALQRTMPTAVAEMKELLKYDPDYVAPVDAEDPDAALIAQAAENAGETAEAQSPDPPSAPAEMQELSQSPDADESESVNPFG